jgi:hypothetical protein
MTRAYDEFVAAVFDVVPPQLMLLLLLVVTSLVAVLWDTYPAWIPRRFPRLRAPRMNAPRMRLPRFRLRLPRWDWRRLLWWRRRKRTRAAPAPAPEPTVELPPSPVAATDPHLADRLAAEGRYAEAIRQRLRDTVADLTRAGVIAPQPGWTAAELSALAATNRPPLGPALGGATDLFSQVWYGRLTAGADHDAHMRRLTGEVRAALQPGGVR